MDVVAHRVWLTHRVRDILIAAACLLAHALYLLMSRNLYGQIGYPLDDSWIYQTYARNFAQAGEWAFIPGTPSTGSTSILWTLLLTPAHLLPGDPFWWTQLVGLLMLVGTAIGAARLFDEDPPLTSLLVGLAVALEWHLVWAAASGMETLLFAGMLVWFWVWLRRRDPVLVGHRAFDGLLLGLWGGALMLARPEGALAFGVAAVYGMILPDRWMPKLIWAALAGLGFALIVVPFFGLNYLISGDMFPNTFYAKQTEYQVLYEQAYLLRLAQQIGVVLVGPQILLLPGLVYELYRDLRYRTDWVSLVPWVWALVHLAVYAARLPVTYQHGRYAAPVIPLIVIYGMRGMLRLARPRHRNMAIRLISMTWLASALLLFPAMTAVLGSTAYARDVDFIESEMVATARWVGEHTEPHTMLAVHDIGALGYYAPRPLLDLAGLISPKVIPFMADPDELARFILTSEADYLIVFPRWSPAYEIMISSPHFCPVWSSEEVDGHVPIEALGPMTVYEISREGNCPKSPSAAWLR